MLQPVVSDQGHEGHRQQDADSVVSHPADRALRSPGRRRGDIGVLEDSFTHVQHPSSDQTNVRGCNLEYLLEKLCPQIKRERGPDSEDDCVNERGRNIVHGQAVPLSLER